MFLLLCTFFGLFFGLFGFHGLGLIVLWRRCGIQCLVLFGEDVETYIYF